MVNASDPATTRLVGALHRALSLAIGVSLLFLLYTLGNIEQVPAFLPVALLGLTALTIWRPPVALVILAAAIPLASWEGRAWNYYVAWAEALVVAVAAGWFIRAAAKPGDADDLDSPIQLFSAVVVASFLVYAAAFNWKVTGSPVSLAIGDTFHSYFAVRRAGDALDAAMRLLESMFLLRAASAAARAAPAFIGWLARSAVIGATAAAALNVWRIWEAARRTDAPLRLFARYVATVRENIHYADLNAAGSYFVMMLFVAAGLAWLPRHRKWMGAVLVIAAALWLTGSRAAIVAGVLALLLPATWTMRTLNRRRVLVAATATAILLVCGAAAAQYLPQRGNQHPSIDAILVRWELIKTSLRMTAGHPMFGVGIGQFYRFSGDYSSEALLRLFPVARNENAHNNFLQILAELGIVGFGAFIWILVRAGVHIRARLAAPATSTLYWGIACGIAAFVLTCLVGHPLLIDEPAFVFWLIVGGAAGSTIGPAVAVATRRRYALAAALLLVVLLIPVRANRLMAETDMEHVGFGLSAWQTDVDGTRYRVAGGRSSVFVPNHVRAISIPVRAIDGPRRLRLLLDGRPADVVFVPADRWSQVRLTLPTDPASPARFLQLTLDVVDGSASGSSVLMVGKVEAR